MKPKTIEELYDKDGNYITDQYYTEIHFLDNLLTDAGIPHEKVKLMDGWQIIYRNIHGTIIADAIEHYGSYGSEENLLEIMGLLTPEENESDSVIGYLTAQNVFERMKKHYEKQKEEHQMDINKHFVSGRICTDLELKQTTTGAPVTSFRIASERNFKNRAGERDTDFLSIVAFSGTAEFITKYFSKGRKILIGGRVQARNYTDREGNKRTVVETIADEAYFMDSNRQDGIKDEKPGSNDFKDIDEPDASGDLPF